MAPMVAAWAAQTSGSPSIVAVAAGQSSREANRLVRLGSKSALEEEAKRLGWRVVVQGPVRVVIDPDVEGGGAWEALAALKAFDADSGFAPISASRLSDRSRRALYRMAVPWSDPRKEPPKDFAFVLRVSVSGTLESQGASATFRVVLPDLAETPPLPTREAPPRNNGPASEPAQKPLEPQADSITCVFSAGVSPADRPEAASRAIRLVKERRGEALARLEQAKQAALSAYLRKAGMFGEWNGQGAVALSALPESGRDSILGSLRGPSDGWASSRIGGSRVSLLIGIRTQDAEGKTHDFLTSLNGRRWAP